MYEIDSRVMECPPELLFLGLDYNDNYGVHKMIYDSIKNSPKDY